MKEVKIGVISDTHMRHGSLFLEKVIEEYFSAVDLILHAGDVTECSVLEAFGDKELVVVSGNGDSPEISRRYPKKELIEVNKFRIGVIHGWGMPFGIEKRIMKAFGRIDCLIYGHTHHAVNHYVNNVLFFNPGSFTRSIASLFQRSIGIIMVGGDIKGRIIHIN